MCLYKLGACVQNQRELLLSVFIKSHYVTMPQAEPLLQMTHCYTLDRVSSQLQKQGVLVCFTLRNLQHPFLSPHSTSLSHRPL